MNKTKLILLGAGILGSVVAAAFSTGVVTDAVKSFCDSALIVPADAGTKLR